VRLERPGNLVQRNKITFTKLQAAIIRAISTAYTNCPTNDNTAPFWWLLFHLDMLILAPSTTNNDNKNPSTTPLKNASMPSTPETSNTSLKLQCHAHDSPNHPHLPSKATIVQPKRQQTQTNTEQQLPGPARPPLWH
jgi:hypothetical protein